MSGRDDFPRKVKQALAGRVAYRCSNPDCGARTSGPQADPSKAVNVGVAAHITAASPGGPRFDSMLNSEERSSATNGIWLCQNCAKLVDDDATRYPVATLQSWKRKAELEAFALVGKAVQAVAPPRSGKVTGEEIELLMACAEDGIIGRLRASGYEWIRAGGRDFHNPSDRAFDTRYVDALLRLRARGLCRHDQRMRYVLTTAGFELARSFGPLPGSDA